MAKDPPKHVLALIRQALLNKDRAAKAKAAKKPTLAQRLIPRKGRR